jgi:hypothetical protein
VIVKKSDDGIASGVLRERGDMGQGNVLAHVEKRS